VAYPTPDEPVQFPTPNDPVEFYPTPTDPEQYPTPNDPVQFPTPDEPVTYPTLNVPVQNPESVGPKLGEWTETQWSDNPFLVRVDVSKSGEFYSCGGSIIATHEHDGKGVVLTSAHCVSEAQDMEMWIGCTTGMCVDAVAEVFVAEHYVVHPDYQENNCSIADWCRDDIAVMFLDRAIDVEGAASVPLAEGIEYLTNDANITVFGYYGGSAEGADMESLEWALTNYILPTECDADYDDHEVSGPQDICITDDFPENGGLDTVCMADSGSPALTEDGELIGISSWGLGDCDPMEPTLLTSIPFYYDWIKEQCPECGGVDEMKPTPAAENEIIKENVMMNMDRIVMHQDGASGHREAVSMRDLVILILQIMGVLIISVIAITMIYRRYRMKSVTNEDEKEGENEYTPLLNV